MTDLFYQINGITPPEDIKESLVSTFKPVDIQSIDKVKDYINNAPIDQSILNIQPTQEKETQKKETIDKQAQKLLDTQEKAQTLLQSNDLDFSKDNSVKYTGNQKQLLSKTIDELSKQDASLKYKKDFLMKLAASESAYKLSTPNSKSSAIGWFQFTDGTRKDIMPNVSKTQFANSPELQVLAASKLYDIRLQKSKNEGVYKAAKNKRFSDDDILSAYWLSPKLAKKYFLNNSISGTDGFGTSIPKKIIQVRKVKKDWT